MKDAQGCAKPGCDGEPAAWLTYDYSRRRLWLDGIPHIGGDQWALCSRHAERMKAPVGWAKVDRIGQRVGEADMSAETAAS